MGFHPDWTEISDLVGKSNLIFIKKLSRNDCSWADSPDNGHQNGFFIPREIAESDFFPKLTNSNPIKPHIFDVDYPTFWPASGETKVSRIKHFSMRNPGNPEKEKPRYEWQHTGVPKEQFKSLSPASLLIAGRLNDSVSSAYHWFAVVDSVSDVAEIIETSFELGSDFHFSLFEPSDIAKAPSDAEILIAEISQALKDGTLNSFISMQTIPTPDQLSLSAQDVWLRESKAEDMCPYRIKSPGDVVMRISRDIEYSLFKRFEVRLRASQVARILVNNQRDAIDNIVHAFAQLDAIFLSASQTRKNRAGRSFENHVERLFKDGRIRYEPQIIFGGRRPDFVLPDVKELNNKGDVIIVSLKTTLRERWKQLSLEKPLGEIFLATVDDRVSAEAINEMQQHGIGLMVPESLKKSKETVYEKHANVITFRQFFDDEIRAKRPSFILPI